MNPSEFGEVLSNLDGDYGVDTHPLATGGSGGCGGCGGSGGCGGGGGCSGGSGGSNHIEESDES